MDEVAHYEVRRYRWVVLGVFMFIALMTQILWINFAAINSISAAYYHVTSDEIDLLSMAFMLIYVIMAIPASWVLDKKGFRVGATIGAILTGVFGFLRVFAGANFMLLFILQIGVALGQPFILNAISKLVGRWFPESEHATAAGLGSIAIFLGIIAGMILPSFLHDTSGFEGMLMIISILSLISMVLFVVLAREKPDVPPSAEAAEERAFTWAGVAQLFKMRSMLVLMVVVLIALGAFNAIATWIESIFIVRGFADEAGIIGGVMVFGGILGAAIIPIISDKLQKRKEFLTISFAMATPFLIGIAVFTDIVPLMISSGLFGFFLMSALPIGLEYAAEQTSPIPEATSNGILMMMGQIGGVVLILGALGVSDLVPWLLSLAACLGVGAILTFLLEERPVSV